MKQQILTKGNTCNNPSLPGTVGTPAFFIVSLAVDLSPMTLMLSGCEVSKFQINNPHLVQVVVKMILRNPLNVLV